MAFYNSLLLIAIATSKAKLDPLGLAKREDIPDLDLSAHGLTKSDLDTVFNTGNLEIGKSEATLAEMIEAMEAIYCGSIGVEYMHIVDTKEKRWIQQRLESARGKFNFSNEQKKGFLERLTAAEGLENISVINTSALNVLVLKAANLLFLW